ncbi:ABC transporter permease [Candidatus Lucifugimonas marina]|jgi:peptide/nickel transport system permease protein|uniref:ABC transporter permease subunit n=1 Tax=Candidatus Lucifugimonas marina TaxID=3038979 RepID=A0AAJ5ZGH2_9CHLR|nr:ABC transporter permease subunit [SAR202 cluster bacterium JH702]MDG0869837.1 ABC transporter permease subunit [SAR202 cluster bacterium JH639]WFG34564.1 ABC transporter permease subunit [SAR202 cluster bacterium JH545]WFG38492.1 ABC transporter permease subunit [SAR202 cluster bacterium JH1073]
MANFLARRFLSSLVSVIGATIAIFVLIQFHSDPRELFIPDSGYGITQEQWEALGERMGLNDPLWKQYLTWVGNTLRGDLGVSLARDRAVVDLIKGKIGATVQLAIGGWIFAIALGIPMGVLAAVKRGTFWDYFGRGMAIVGQAAPPFVTGLVAIWFFAVWLEWLPAGGRSPDFNWKEYLLPCMALGWGAAASLMRLTRSSMLEVMDSEYIRLARAKGVGWNWVIYKHALRNALIAPVTSALLVFSGWLNGALVVEIVFSWPGIGYDALFRAVNDNDFPLLLGTVFIFILIYLVFATIADIAYTLIDPRVRLGNSAD